MMVNHLNKQIDKHGMNERHNSPEYSCIYYPGTEIWGHVSFINCPGMICLSSLLLQTNNSSFDEQSS